MFKKWEIDYDIEINISYNSKKQISNRWLYINKTQLLILMLKWKNPFLQHQAKSN
jgi:hypothetical protein